MRAHRLFLFAVGLSACNARVEPSPAIQPEPPPTVTKPVFNGTPLVDEVTFDAVVKANSASQLAFPDQPGEVPLLLRQIYDANANGIPDPDERTVPRWGVRIVPVDQNGIQRGKSRLLFTPERTDVNSGVFVKVPAGRYKVQFINPSETVAGSETRWFATPMVSLPKTETILNLQPVGQTQSTVKVITNLAFCALTNADGPQIQPFPGDSFATWKCRLSYAPQDLQLQTFLKMSVQRNSYWGVVTRPYQPVTLSWASDYDTKAVFDQGIGEVPGNSVTVQPSVTTKYTLTLKNEFGRSTFSETIIPSANSRLNPNFGTNGYLLSDQRIVPAAVQSDGKIVAYRSFDPGQAMRLVRLNADGSLDSSFRAPDIRAYSAPPRFVEVFPDDTIATCDLTGTQDARLYFLQPDGTPLNGFGENGSISVPNCNSLSTVRLAENEVAVTRTVGDAQELLYVNKNGVKQAVKLDSFYDRLFPVGDDQFLAVSYTSRRGGTITFVDWNMRRLNGDGTVDPSFTAIQGGAVHSFPGSRVTGVIQSGNVILVNTGFAGLAAYDLDGNPKPSYFAQLNQFFNDTADSLKSYSMYGQNFSYPFLLRWNEAGFTAVLLEGDGGPVPYYLYDGAASVFSPGFRVSAVIPTKNGWLISGQEPTRFNPEPPYAPLETPKYVTYMLR